MNLRLTLSIAALALSVSTLQAQPQPNDPKAVLAQLDTASQHFKNVQAEVKYDNYTRAVRADEISTGILYVEHASSGTQMGAIVYDLGPDGKPATTPSKILSYDGKTLQIFAPGVNQVDVFKAGANQAKYEGFLTLGFGGSGTALAKSWNIQDQGPETIDGVKTEKLFLTGNDSVTSTFSHVTIWVDPKRGISLKQVFLAPNGDMRTATYTNIKLNASINKKPYGISNKANHINH